MEEIVVVGGMKNEEEWVRGMESENEGEGY